jgi:L-2-hydroxyglutarate oxidase
LNPRKVSRQTDVLILGGGIIGLSSGIAALEMNPALKVLIADKAKSVAEHASGRNSGVLHAGFYYSPESLKAQFCREGSKELKAFATTKNLPILNCGKVVVTKNETEVTRLEMLFERGLINQVELELLPEKELSRIENSAKTLEKFIWSPTTAVLNPMLLMQSLLEHFIQLGGKIEFETKFSLCNSHGEIYASSSEQLIESKKIVNATGVHSDSIAKEIGVGTSFVALPFRGNYRKSTKNSVSNRLIYPVPHPINPFLGVHTTLTPEGSLKIGPTAILAMGRENYQGLSNLRVQELIGIIRAARIFMGGTKHDLVEILKLELPLLTRRGLVRAASVLSNEVSNVKNWEKTKSGIRSQLVNANTGELVQDFVVERYANSIHFLNIVSPGWTSALPFTRHFMADFLDS